MEIIDNFLKREEFNELQALMMLNNNLPWYYNDRVVRANNNPDEFQFTHNFYKGYQPHSPYYINLNPIILKLKPKAIIRIKANLLARTPKIIQFPLHVDFNYIESPFTTSIFYLNTNNGHTIFEDGTKVESVANRMIIFPGDMSHTGTTCTDEQIRVVINFDYF